MSKYRLLERGDVAPWFNQRSSNSPDFSFNTIGGRYIVLCFFGSAADPEGREMLSLLEEHRALFDDQRITFFGVSGDPADESEQRVRESIPGIRFFWDFDGKIGRLYGALPAEGAAGAAPRRMWVVISPSFRVLRVFHGPGDHAQRAEIAACLESLPAVDQLAGFRVDPPIIVLPDVFEPQLCAYLIDLYERNGGTESGVMREIDGRTVAVSDGRRKRRADYQIEDEDLIARLRARFVRRVVPEIMKVHQFAVSRMERYIVACYDSSNGGHFTAHRDNTTKGTAHRRFACSINLNADFEGGEVSFPEYGQRSYKPPVGGAVVFSCSLLHAVSPVTAGRRFAFLPFLYDEAAARVRDANLGYVGALPAEPASAGGP